MEKVNENFPPYPGEQETQEVLLKRLDEEHRVDPQQPYQLQLPRVDL